MQVENATRLNTQKQLSTCRINRRCRMAPSQRAKAAASARTIHRLNLKREREREREREWQRKRERERKREIEREKERAGKSQSISRHESPYLLQDAGFFWRRYGNRGLRRRSRALSIVSSATRWTHAISDTSYLRCFRISFVRDNGNRILQSISTFKLEMMIAAEST